MNDIKPKRKAVQIKRDATRASVVVRLMVLGIDIPDDLDQRSIINAPNGYTFISNDCHAIYGAVTYSGMIEALKDGIQACGNDCEYCIEQNAWDIY